LLAALRAASLARVDARLAVGFSGGLDSSVLLQVACLVAQDLGTSPPLAVHVHHGLQAAADDWATHCERTAADLGAAFTLKRITVERAGGESPEAAAREARQAALTAAADESDADALLLAHHRDDQSETVLFNALRGTGLPGLAGIPAARTLGERRLLLRPFLGLPRDALERWAREQALGWIDDPSNADTTLRRNLLRQRVLPLLATAMPQAPASLARLARHAAEAQRLADDLAELDAATWTDARGLRCNAFVELPSHRARNLLRRLLAQHGLRMPDSAKLDEMLRQLAGGGRPDILHEGHRVTRLRGRLQILPAGR